MRAILGILGLVLVVAIIYFVFKTQAGGEGGMKRIDDAAVRSDLLSIAQAERRYLAANGTFASLEQLQQAGEVQFQGTGRRGYTYAIETDSAAHFKITATPSDPVRTDQPTLSIDENMQISTK